VGASRLWWKGFVEKVNPGGVNPAMAPYSLSIGLDPPAGKEFCMG